MKGTSPKLGRKGTKRNSINNKRKSIGGGFLPGTKGVTALGVTVSNSAQRNVKVKSSRDKLRREKERRDQLQRKIKDSLRTRELKTNRSVDYKLGVKTKTKKENESGVVVSSQVLKRKKAKGDAKKTIRLDQIRLDDPSKLKDTIEVLNATVKPDDPLGDIEINVSGIEDLGLIQSGLQDLDSSITIKYIFRDTENFARKLEDGFGGIKIFMETAKDKPGNEKIKQIEKLVEQLNENGTDIKGVGKELKLFRSLELLLASAKKENIDKESEQMFMKALENSITLELRRQRKPNQEIRAVTYNNFAKMITQDSFRNFNINAQYLGKVKDLVSDIAVAARLAPNEIGKLFNAFDVPNPTGDTDLTYGGQIQELLKDAFSPENSGEALASKIENLESDIRDQMAVALKQIGKSIKAEDIPDGFFTKKYLNTDPPEPIAPIVKNENEGIVGRIINVIEKTKGKKVQGDLTSLNTGTASDVYAVTTQGNIGFSGTNQGFAKKALKDKDRSNETTHKLKIDKEKDTQDYRGILIRGKLKENPVLIAREVGSSRLDRGLGINVLSDQVFSKNGKDIIGISAKVPGKSIRELVKVKGPDETPDMQLIRNFDYTNPNTQKGLSDLQIMDAITGQLDRHLSNIFIDPKTGKVYGIDNDMAFPLNENVTWGDFNNATLSGLFTGEGKNMKYNQNFIDVDTGKKILAMKEREFRKILDGKMNDPEKLDSKYKEAAVDRFLAVQRRVQELDNQNPSGLISEWTPEIQRRTIEDGNNLMSRAVQAFETAGNPDDKSLAQGL